MNRHPAIELLRSTRIWSGRIFGVLRERIRLPSGLEQDLSIVEHPAAVAVAAVDGEGRLLLVRQYRHAAGDWLIELPAGRLEPGEEPLEGARRELEEETGFRAATWRELTRFYTAPGFCSELMHVFLATDLELAELARVKDPDEEFEHLRMHPCELLRHGCKDAKSIVAAQLLLLGSESDSLGRGNT